MSSGYGMTGGPGRCFPFWQELLACYVVNTNSDDVSGQTKCSPALQDYYECLHHKKELARALHMQAAYSKKISEEGRGEIPSAGEMRQLGLVKGEKPEDVHIKTSKWLPHMKRSIT